MYRQKEGYLRYLTTYTEILLKNISVEDPEPDPDLHDSGFKDPDLDLQFLCGSGCGSGSQ